METAPRPHLSQVSTTTLAVLVLVLSACAGDSNDAKDTHAQAPPVESGTVYVADSTPCDAKSAPSGLNISVIGVNCSAATALVRKQLTPDWASTRGANSRSSLTDEPREFRSGSWACVSDGQPSTDRWTVTCVDRDQAISFSIVSVT